MAASNLEEIQKSKSIQKTFPVQGMTCASCVNHVEKTLKQQEGVLSASVNLATATASVEFVPEIVSAESLRTAVQGVGYDLFIDESESAKENLEIQKSAEYRKLKARTIGAMILAAPVVIIGMFLMNMPYANYIMWIFSTPVILWFGKNFFINAWKQARHGSANMDTLVALSTGVAYIFSVFNTLNPEFWHARGIHPHVYFEAAAVVIAFILLGKWLEEKAKGNTSSAIRKLMGLQPGSVTILKENGDHTLVPIDSVEVGNIILVKPGEKIAVDGVVTDGSSYVDESMLSGEAMAVQKSVNDKVYAGTINQKGSLRFKAEKVGKGTMLARIVKMVEDAQGSKAPVQNLVDKIAAIFVPVVMIIALITFVAWWIFGGENGFTQGLMAMVTVLIIACPCALGLATPTAIMVGIGRAAEKGILIKDAQSLELAKNVNALILDKTGTITEGKPKVTDIHWTNENEFHKDILYTLEKSSEHPLAEAIIEYLQGAKNLSSGNFQSVTGKGAILNIEGKEYFAGNKNLLQVKSINLPADLLAISESWSTESKTVVWFADEKNVLAIIAIADSVKESSAEAIRELQQNGIEVYMLTGDNENTAKAIANQTGIQHYQAETLPDEKANFVKDLQQKGKVVAMVGDGINDSAALAQADVSIAMGKGSDIAMEVARMTIISSDLLKIPMAIRLSGKTARTIRQNLFWAFIYNIIGIPIAAGILYPFNGFLLNPMIAGAAMALSSVSVVSNSLRLKWAG
jgi:Cu2+-exporting ATPase